MKFKLLKSNGVLAGYADTIQEAMSSCDINKGWYFEKEKKLTKEERIHKVIRLCVNKQLEKYGLTYDDVKRGGSYEFYYFYELEEKKKFFGLWKTKKLVQKSKPWYQLYIFESEQEFNEWKEFCINLFRKELKMSKAKAESEFAWFNLSYGLRQNYQVKV